MCIHNLSRRGHGRGGSKIKKREAAGGEGVGRREEKNLDDIRVKLEVGYSSSSVSHSMRLSMIRADRRPLDRLLRLLEAGKDTAKTRKSTDN